MPITNQNALAYTPFLSNRAEYSKGEDTESSLAADSPQLATAGNKNQS